MNKFLILSFVILGFSSCAQLHHVQVGDIDNRNGGTLVPFEILVNELGFSTQEIGRLAGATSSDAGGQLQNIAAIVQLFQMGPRTGNLTYNQSYAERLVYQIYEKCPTGQVTGLVSIREMRKYPVISGEIVKVTGFCRHSKTTASFHHSSEGDI